MGRVELPRQVALREWREQHSGKVTNPPHRHAINLTTFLEAYIQDMANNQEWICEYYMEKKCNCNDDDAWGDGYNGGNNCYYQCFMENDMQYCLGDGDGNNNNNGNGDFDLEEYIICAESAYGNNNNNNGNYDNIEYIGPYCNEQGGDVYLGSFTDMYCSIATGSKTNYAYGGALPYSKESGQAIVSRDCNPFGQPADDDRYSQYQVKEDFELLYMSAAKCETDMTHNYVSETGCGYMEGLQHVSEDGIIRPGIRPNIITTAFIGLFFTSSVLLGSYVYYLRNSECTSTRSCHCRDVAFNQHFLCMTHLFPLFPSPAEILSGAKVNLAYQ